MSTSLGALTADTTYHFRLVATNSAGTTAGEDQVLTTSNTQNTTPTTTNGTETTPPTGVPAGTTPTSNAPSLCVPTLTVSKQRRATIRRHGLRFSVRCAPAGSIAASLVVNKRLARRLHLSSRKALVIGRARRVLDASGTPKLVLRLKRRARRALAHSRPVTITLKVVINDADGTRTLLTRRVRA
jgi:hypothetical protein